MTLLVCILGGLGCAVLGIVAGYRYCARVEGRIFQALVDCGELVVKTDEGWVGEPDALKEIRKCE
jgi:hypothetical protein